VAAVVGGDAAALPLVDDLPRCAVPSTSAAHRVPLPHGAGDMEVGDMADKIEHFEVWYAEPDGHQRHQKADTEAQAVAIAEDHHMSGFGGVTAHKITTVITTAEVKLHLPDRAPV
jgi:hypothetical protein